MTRLSADTLDRIGSTVQRHQLDRERLRPGIVHLGIGAFFRAHAALFTQEAVQATGDHRWGVVAATQVSRTTYDQLDPQDCLYTVTERTADRASTVLVQTVIDVTRAPAEAARVVEQIASPQTHLVTLTITEKGYYQDPRSGGLDLSAEPIAADLVGAAPRTAIGQIARGLQRRQQHGSGPLTVLSCDNLHENGRLTQRLVTEFVTALPADQAEPLLAWMAENVTFPSSMVDRMVPAPTAGDIEELEQRIGLRDEAAVFTETFRQWVIEDAFAGPRPAWELVGAQFTDDVPAWEQAKLQLLNASHSLAAYLGMLVGADTIAQATDDPRIRFAVEQLMDEAVRVLDLPAGFRPTEYCAEVVQRFLNPTLGHTVVKVGSDGSQKLAPRLLSTAQSVLASGGVPTWSALAVAAWMRVVATAPSAQALNDPLAERLVSSLPADINADAGSGSAAAVVAALLSTPVFPPGLAADADFGQAVTRWYAALQVRGLDAITDPPESGSTP